MNKLYVILSSLILISCSSTKTAPTKHIVLPPSTSNEIQFRCSGWDTNSKSNNAYERLDKTKSIYFSLKDTENRYIKENSGKAVVGRNGHEEVFIIHTINYDFYASRLNGNIEQELVFKRNGSILTITHDLSKPEETESFMCFPK
ncbi:hypothetical protein [Thalassomonas sp. M1454]|uniref:hypothetical protein n=1 Tax=Thalassomonas sp. M1454 TaxID=2594477 RepID=UPI00117DFCE4|nr:hypothetical protein [Thalassomonas sp. M1454]TRX57984.1 hypothetical protein FNN08_00940 [Thalassomonas sp. M1454]